MAGIKKTRAELFEDFDAPFATGNNPTNSDFQDLGASLCHKDDPLQLPVSLETMVSDETFDATVNYIERDPAGANRNLDPSGDFIAGHQIIVVNNADAAETITFDSDGLGAAVAQNERGIFIFNGADWRTIFIG